MDPDNENTFREYVIPSDHRETQRPKAAIMKALGCCGFCADATFAVKLALEEALANAVKHGNAGDPAKRITIRYAVNNEKAVVIVRDEGSGFLPDAVPDPTAPERLALPNGRGIMLMRAYVDEIRYRDRGREVYFMKRRE
ncbi:MAG: ATP-binding protein [Phycisphaerae bacterium]